MGSLAAESQAVVKRCLDSCMFQPSRLDDNSEKDLMSRDRHRPTSEPSWEEDEEDASSSACFFLAFFLRACLSLSLDSFPDSSEDQF